MAVRAGNQAAGFGALAEFLDQLSRKIIQGAIDISQQSLKISKATTNVVATPSALSADETVQGKDNNYEHEKSQIILEQEELEKMTRMLQRRLSDLKQELDVGRVLASMSLVEASQSNRAFTAQLSDNARKIRSAIERIEVHVVNALTHLK